MPKDGSYRPSVFLGGGITGCLDWQTTTIDTLTEGGVDAVVFNPRRVSWPGTGSNGPETVAQIAWEYERLANADIVSFWFDGATLCPITLLELGVFLNTDRPLVVSCAEDYQRRFDVIRQCSHYRPDVMVNTGLFQHISAIEEAVAGHDERFLTRGF